MNPEPYIIVITFMFLFIIGLLIALSGLWLKVDRLSEDLKREEKERKSEIRSMKNKEEIRENLRYWKSSDDKVFIYKDVNDEKE